MQNLFNLADQRSADVLEECTSRGIAFVPFCPLGWPRGVQNEILTSPVLAELGARLRATPAQIALAWLLDLAPNILLIPGTRTRAHLTENLGAADVELDDASRAELGAPLLDCCEPLGRPLAASAEADVAQIDRDHGQPLRLDHCGLSPSHRRTSAMFVAKGHRLRAPCVLTRPRPKHYQQAQDGRELHQTRTRRHGAAQPDT